MFIEIAKSDAPLPFVIFMFARTAALPSPGSGKAAITALFDESVGENEALRYRADLPLGPQRRLLLVECRSRRTGGPLQRRAQHLMLRSAPHRPLGLIECSAVVLWVLFDTH